MCRDRLLNVWILVLDFLFLGRWPSNDELRRRPSDAQLKVFRRLRTFLSACGDTQERFDLCPGRSSPELGSALFHLEAFCHTCKDLSSGYMECDAIPFKPSMSLLSVDDHPEQQPYRSLDASRLKLVGEGNWNMESYLDGPLWLPFQEPSFLLHGQFVSSTDVPNFEAESPEECLKLAKIWDARGLLCLLPEPIAPGLYSRVFNAFKDKDRDRQIGDRRVPNLSEYHVDGPSKHLPQGPQLTQVRVPRFTHLLRGSVTDRRDFYHQASVTLERAQSNMLPFAYPSKTFVGLQAYTDLQQRLAAEKTCAREVVGDKLGRPRDQSKSKKHPALLAQLHPCFASLFQGDHLGVEFALRSHSLLLENHGLLLPENRILGGLPVPTSGPWDALVIDDYFAFGAEPISSLPEKSFAMKSLAVAREVYREEGLMGSDEKDVIAQPCFKAAGAEIRLSAENARSGVIPVGAPFAKRIALSVLSLRSAALPGTSARLVSRLAGNWVSALQYRKCLSSIIDGLFKLSSECLEEPTVCVHRLPRTVAQELTMLAAIAPLTFSNVAVDFLNVAFATDASVQKGAIVATPLGAEEHEALWQSADKRGAYTHLDNGFRCLLRQVGEVDDDADIAGPLHHAEPLTKQPLLYFDFVEICGGAGKVTQAVASFGRSVAPVLDLSNSRHYNLSCLRLTEWIIYMIEENRFRSFLIAPPCTSFSPAAHPAVRSYREPLGFDRLNPKTFLGNQLAFRTLTLL